MQNYYLSDDMHGRFAEVKELEEAYKIIDLNADGTNACGMPIISDGRKVLVSGPEENCMIMGGCGSMKTRLLVLPCVENIAYCGNSMIINDPKGEIYGYCIDTLKKKNYKVKILNFREPLRGDTYNPVLLGVQLYKSGKKGKAIQFFRTLGETIYKGIEKKEDPFWTDTSIDYFTALAMILSQEMPEEEISLETIFNLHMDGMERNMGPTLLQEYLKVVNKERRIKQFSVATVDAPNETRSSIWSVFSSGLSRLTIDDEVSDMLSGKNSFDIRDITKEKTAVFIISRDETCIHNAIISALIDQWYTELILLAEETGGVLERPVDFILDEFGNLAKINDINSKITAARSRGLRFMLVVQSLKQISHVYGKDVAEIIMGNCQNWAYLNSSDPELNKLLSERCGTYMSEYTQEIKKLVPLERIQYLDKKRGEVLMLLNRQRPFITYLPDITKYVCYGEKKPIDYPVRELCERKSFDIRKRINEVKEEETSRMLERMAAERTRKYPHYEEQFNNWRASQETEFHVGNEEEDGDMDDMFAIPDVDEDFVKEIKDILEEDDE